MVNALIQSIAGSLNAEFGDGYGIYTEGHTQDQRAPCFVIRCIGSAERHFFWKRYFRENRFCIDYFPESEENGREECDSVAGRLFSCLEYLEAGEDLVRGSGRNYEMKDGILNFFVNYDMFVYKVSESVPVMEGVSTETSVKGQVKKWL